jgi:molecular chaperone GrpE
MAKHKKEKEKKEKTASKENELENTEEVEIESEEKLETEIEVKVSEEKIDELESEINQLQDRLLRKAAEFENYKRRTENDQLNLLTYAAESFIVNLLPILDDLERTMKHIDDDDNDDAVKEGIKLLYNKFNNILDAQGVKKIDSVGKTFNVDYHDALMQQKDESVPAHTILEEIETGYLYKDKVIRHAKVIVNEESSVDLPEDANEENNSHKEEK